jgi:putative SOS response-associated peptidase YedK
MCNAYNLKTNLAEIGAASRSWLGRDLVLPPGVTPESSNLQVSQSVYPRRDGLILRPIEDGLEPAVAHWNLTPFFNKGGLKAWKASTNNARSETMATSPAFREAYRRRRCIIPVTSFTEWTGPKGTKTAHAISRKDGGMLFFAGLWDRCDTDDGPADSYTMVMIDALGDDDVARFHNRQPVFLDRDRADTWLDLTADPVPILKGPVAGTLVADPPEPVPG